MSLDLVPYIENNILFDEKQIGGQYRSLSSRQLERELEHYREFCINSVSNTSNQQFSQTDSNIYIPQIPFVKDDKFIKQSALYFDKVVIPDPLFAQTGFIDAASLPKEDLIGKMRPEKLYRRFDRRKIAKSSKMIAQLKVALANNLMVILPTSYISEYRFEQKKMTEILNAKIEKDFIDECRPFAVRKEHYQSNMLPNWPELLILDLKFKHYYRKNSWETYFPMSVLQMTPSEPKDGKVTINVTPGEPIKREQVDYLVDSYQVNCIKQIISHVSLESKLAASFSASLFVNDRMTNTILKRLHAPQDLDVANWMGLNLPYFSDVDLKEVFQIRLREPEAFERFRSEMKELVGDLRKLHNHEDYTYFREKFIRQRIEEPILELNERTRLIRYKYFKSNSIGLISLMFSFITNSMDGFGAGQSLMDFIINFKDASQELQELKREPMYAYWKSLYV